MQCRNFLRRFSKQFHPAAYSIDPRIQLAAQMEQLEIRRLFTVYNLTAVPVLTFQEGTTANLVTVATFESDAPTADLSAVINLSGVGTPSPDTATIVASGSELIPGVGIEPEYSVKMTNVAIGATTGPNQLPYSVQVTDTSATAATPLAFGSMQVVVAPLTAGAAVPPTTVTEGFSVLPTADLFDFTDGYLSSTPADFTTTVDWGDGTPTSIGVVGQFSPGSFFISSGGHTYDQVGSYTIKITVQDNEFGGSTIESTSGAITVNDATLSNGTASAVTGVEGQALNNVLLGTFQVSDPYASTASYTASVNWGDGSSVDNGIVTLLSTSLNPSSYNSTFGVYDSHEYTTGGVYSFSVAVGDNTGVTVNSLIAGSATISGLSAGTSVPETGNTGTLLSDSEVGSFTDTNPTAPTTDFTANIDWGDGSPQSAGVITQPGGAGTAFVVEGNHTYANPGAYTVSAIVLGDGTSTSLSSAYTITDLPVTGSTKNLTAIEGQDTGSFVLATFEDPNTLATVSSIEATLAIGGWGDGTPTTTGNTLVIQQIGVDPANSDPIFEVLGSHTYAEETPAGLPDTLSVIIETSGGETTTLTSPPGGGVTVLDANLTGSSGNTITDIEGNSTGTVSLGTFVDANQAATATDYTSGSGSVVVNWGDGSAPQTLTAGDLSAIGSPNGVEWTVNAAHTYTEEGTFAYTVTVTDAGGSTTIISGSASIADAALTAGSPVALTPNTGIALPNSTVVATFTDANAFATTSDYTALVNWGDGSPASTGILVATATPGVFDIEAAHSYATPGSYTTIVNVSDDGGSTVTVTGSATVTDLPVTGSTKNFTAVEGQNTGLFVLATFEDPNTLATVADVNATLAIGGWGDGTPTTTGNTLVIQQIGVDPANSDPIFEVLGSHTYAEETPAGLPDTLSVIIATSGGATTTLTSPPGGGVTVLDAPLTGTSGNIITGVEGSPTGSILLGTFVDANQAATVADYTTGSGMVAVDWGDGSAPEILPASDIRAAGNADGITWAINAAHTYSEEGTYSYTVVVADDGGAITTLSGSAVIADAALTAFTGADLTPNAGATVSSSLGSFFDANPGAQTSDFTAMIYWGDGSNSVGTLAQPNGAGNPFTVSGTHVYAKPGAYDITANVTDAGGSTVTLTSDATVTDLPVTGAVSSFPAVEGQNTGTIVLGMFTDPNPLATISDVHAFLPVGGWGDGTPAAAGTLTVMQIGGTSTSTIFEITGSHTYASTGSLPVNISVTTSGGATTNLTAGTATVASSITGGVLVAGTTPTINTTAGLSTGTVVVGTFTDSNSSAGASNYSAVIDWGDGSPTTIGTISFTPGTGGGPATVQVDGVHTYANPGAYTILVITDSNGGQAVTTTAAANVASDVLTAVATPVINTTPNVSTGSVVVSSFTDSDLNTKAGDFSASINWGDGSDTNAGTVSVTPGTGGNPATVTINGIHTYAAFGQYTIQVTTTSADGQSITTDATADVSAPHLVFLTQPTSTTAGQKLSTFKVEAVDASGNIVAADHSVVTLIGQPGTKANGKLLGNVTVKLNRGVATFSNVSIDVADQYAIRATDGQYAAATSSNFTITPSAVTHLVVSSVPTNAAHASPFPVQVEVLDQYGNIVDNSSTVTLKLGKHPHGAALSGTTSVAASAGVANFSNLVINQAGIYSLIATDKPLFKAASGKFAVS